MKFNITQTFSTVESYLSQFLKVSKKNIHTIRMNSHHNKETIKINAKEADLRNRYFGKLPNLRVQLPRTYP